mmetsp:Transcript_7455/g.9488  ORF Transcript_7455/g.9488 Transcript_7455/m.9488 type:complete len:304 (-) Transcript_7455:1259-2170(-)
MIRISLSIYTQMQRSQSKQKITMMRVARAATLTALSSHSNAFQIMSPTSRMTSLSPLFSDLKLERVSQFTGLYSHRHSHPTTTRMYFSRNNRDDDDESILSKTKNKLKSIVPSFLKPKSSLTVKEKAKDEVSSSIDKMLKDAPLGLRMMGKIISPIISSVAGNLAQTMEEQSRQMSDVLDDAKRYIVLDENAIKELGEPIEVGSPFSQSSRSMSVNGRTQSSINASFEVRGCRSGGVATVDSSDGKISSLFLNINGRTLSIDVTGSPKTTVSGGSSKRSSGLGKNRITDDDNIIDAEFVEKKI